MIVRQYTMTAFLQKWLRAAQEGREDTIRHNGRLVRVRCVGASLTERRTLGACVEIRWETVR